MRAHLLLSAAFASAALGSAFGGGGLGPRLTGGFSINNNGRSKYMPHQGKQEIARRLKRMNHGLSR